MIDDIDILVTHITNTVATSSLHDEEKADIIAQLTAGMHRLVWPILLSHVPQYLLDDATNNPEQFTMDDYVEMIDVALRNPATAKELHEELKGALEEVKALLDTSL